MLCKYNLNKSYGTALNKQMLIYFIYKLYSSSIIDIDHNNIHRNGNL